MINKHVILNTFWFIDPVIDIIGRFFIVAWITYIYVWQRFEKYFSHHRAKSNMSSFQNSLFLRSVVWTLNQPRHIRFPNSPLRNTISYFHKIWPHEAYNCNYDILLWEAKSSQFGHQTYRSQEAQKIF